MSPAARAAPSLSDRKVVHILAISPRSRARSSPASIRVVHVTPGAVPPQSVPDVDVLLEVVPKRKVEKRRVVGRELHRRREPALDNREVACSEVPVEVVDVGVHRDQVVRKSNADRSAARRRRPSEARERGLSASGIGSADLAQERAADAGAAGGDDADSLVGRVAELGAEARLVA